MPARPDRRRTYSKRSLHGQVAHELGMRIVSGHYQEGDILPREETASADMAVSRTAYREAIKLLAAKGLLESRPKSGTRIRPRHEWHMLDPDVLAWCFAAGPSPSHARSLFELRRIIEPAAAAFAAERATPAQIDRIDAALQQMQSVPMLSDAGIAADIEFHQAVLEASNNELLSSLGHMIESALDQAFRLTFGADDATDKLVPIHADLLNALRQKDKEAAIKATNTLLDHAWPFVRDEIG